MSSCLPLYDFLFHQLFKITELLERLKVALKKKHANVKNCGKGNRSKERLQKVERKINKGGSKSTPLCIKYPVRYLV